MPVAPYLYRRLRGFGVPHAMAERFANTDASAPGGTGTIADLPEEATISDVADKLNELIDVLRDAGVIEG